LILNKNKEKRVDSHSELYDFSTNKLDSKKKYPYKLELKSININTANEDILTKLPGIGKSIANRIVKLRKSKGRFSRLEELIEVKGIGDKKLENIKIYLFIEN